MPETTLDWQNEPQGAALFKRPVRIRRLKSAAPWAAYNLLALSNLVRMFFRRESSPLWGQAKGLGKK